MPRINSDVDAYVGVDKHVWPQYRAVYDALLKLGAAEGDAQGVLKRTARKALGLSAVKARGWVTAHIVKDFP